MRLIIGLGNPGKKYESTRHNAGRMAVDLLAKKLNLKFKKHTRTETEIASGKEIIVAKPLTFMNNSGRAVAKVARYFGIPTEAIIVIYDDIDLPFGTIRSRTTGSSGGHNGMQSVLDNLKTNSIARIRIGVGRPPSDASNYVLEPLNKKQLAEISKVIEEVVDLFLKAM